MSVCVNEDDVLVPQANGLPGGLLVGEQQGARRGFCMGIAYYEKEEYSTPGVHEDQEGFYVLEGSGTAKVGEEEFPVRAGTAFIANAGVAHSVKRAPTSGPVKLVWAHGAV